MGRAAQADEKGAVGCRLPLLAVSALLAALALAPNAIAAGIGKGQVVETPTRVLVRADGMIAPTASCPGQNAPGAPAEEQVAAMRCMTDFARLQAGLGALAEAPALDASAQGKSGDILSCNEFSHFACGREFTYWMEASGYLEAQCWRAGENLAWGTGEEGSVRSIFRAWMHSPGHRQNVLGDFDQLGISLRVGDLAGRAGTHVWTQHFGSHC